MPANSIPISLSAPSASDTGDALISPEFSVSFGDKIPGAGGGGSSPLNGMVKEFAYAVAVAMFTKWAWSKIR